MKKLIITSYNYNDIGVQNSVLRAVSAVKNTNMTTVINCIMFRS